MTTFFKSARSAVLAAVVGLEAAALPPHEMHAQDTPRTTPNREKTDNTAAPAKAIWTTGDVYQELGGVKSTVQIITNSLQANSASTVQKRQWAEQRIAIEDYISLAEQSLKGDPSQQELNGLGLGLKANNTALGLFLTQLNNPRNQPDHSVPSESGNIPGAKPSQPSIVGVYSVPELYGMQNAARLSLPILQDQFTRNGRRPSPLELEVLNGLTQIKEAKDPTDLQNRLIPTIDRVASSLPKLREQLGQQNTPAVLEDLEKRIKPPTKGTEPPSNANDKAIQWSNELQKLIDADPTIRLHPAARAAHRARQFDYLIGLESGRTMVQQGAAGLKEALAEQPKETPQFSKLLQSLETIAATPTQERLPSDTLDTMMKALELYKAKDAASIGQR